MTKHGFRNIDLGRLVGELNSRLDKQDSQITLGAFVDKTPKRRRFLDSIDDSEVKSRRKYPLILTSYGGGVLNSIFDLDSDNAIGYLLVESGYIQTSSSYGGAYESLKLRIEKPLKLKNGIIVPQSSMEIRAEIPEWSGLEVMRADYFRKFRTNWGRADLEKIIPTDWFLKDGTMEMANSYNSGNSLHRSIA